MDFGERLRILRKKAGMTQQELAEKANVSKSVISFYEHKDRAPSPEVLKRFAEIFEVSTDFLLGIERNTPNMIDVSGLTESEIAALQIIVESMKEKKKWC